MNMKKLLSAAGVVCSLTFCVDGAWGMNVRELAKITPSQNGDASELDAVNSLGSNTNIDKVKTLVSAVKGDYTNRDAELRKWFGGALAWVAGQPDSSSQNGKSQADNQEDAAALLLNVLNGAQDDNAFKAFENASWLVWKDVISGFQTQEHYAQFEAFLKGCQQEIAALQNGTPSAGRDILNVNCGVQNSLLIKWGAKLDFYKEWNDVVSLVEKDEVMKNWSVIRDFLGTIYKLGTDKVKIGGTGIGTKTRFSDISGELKQDASQKWNDLFKNALLKKFAGKTEADFTNANKAFDNGFDLASAKISLLEGVTAASATQSVNFDFSTLYDKYLDVYDRIDDGETVDSIKMGLDSLYDEMKKVPGASVTFQ